jgi:sigma-E factor negative regulatory protein RseC
MIEESATVIFVDDGYAVVETRQRPACGSCASSGSCGTSLLSALFKRRYNRLRVSNPIGARPGDLVIIGMQENILLRVSFVAYLLPLACMMMMAMAMQAAATQFTWQLGELPQVLGGLLGLIAGFFLLKRPIGLKRNESDYQAVILRLANTTQVEFSGEHTG